jgi:uncharacterized SAM-binding protein YcdF (DUF218 family)
MKDIVQLLTTPSSFIALLLIIGIAALFFRRLRKLAMILLIIAGIIYIALASGPVSYWLIGRLEHRYPALTNIDTVKNVKKIVVLAGHADADPYFPISSAVNSSSAFRLMEAARLHNLISGSKILITGSGDVPEVMKKVLLSLGIPDQTISIDNQSRNTYESAVKIRQMVGTETIILVTSAGHMIRSVGVFKKVGINTIPAPTDYMTGPNCLAANYFPTASHLTYSDLAVHEYLGIVWYKITGRL